MEEEQIKSNIVVTNLLDNKNDYCPSPIETLKAVLISDFLALSQMLAKATIIPRTRTSVVVSPSFYYYYYYYYY